MHLCTAIQVLILIATAVVAVPHPQISLPITLPEATLTVTPTTSLNIPITSTPQLPVTTTSLISTGTGGIIPLPGNSSSSSRKKHSHTEPIPIFSRFCDCPDLKTVQYPCWATDSLQRCNFEELHSFICWTSAARGCPYPTRTCSSLFKPTPITGRNPCDMGPIGPRPTETITATEVVPTLTETVILPTITSILNGTSVQRRWN